MPPESRGDARGSSVTRDRHTTHIAVPTANTGIVCRRRRLEGDRDGRGRQHFIFTRFLYWRLLRRCVALAALFSKSILSYIMAAAAAPAIIVPALGPANLGMNIYVTQTEAGVTATLSLALRGSAYNPSTLLGGALS